MAENKENTPEEIKWWIERGPVREREKKNEPLGGIIEKWAYELLKDYSQEQALKSVAGINQRIFKDLSVAPGEWGYQSLDIGKFHPGRLAKIKEALKLPPNARALVIDAAFSVRILITGDPIGERVLDLNFTPHPSMDYWIKGELVEEQLFSGLDQALRKLRPLLNRYLETPPEDQY
jgi:hypothetical protein